MANRKTWLAVIPFAPVFFLDVPSFLVLKSRHTIAAMSGLASRISAILFHCSLPEVLVS